MAGTSKPNKINNQDSPEIYCRELLTNTVPNTLRSNQHHLQLLSVSSYFPNPFATNKQTDRTSDTHTTCGTNSTTLSPESTLPGVSELVIPQQPTQGYWEHALWRLPPRADMRCAATVNKRIAFTRYFPLRLPCRHAAMPSVTIPFLPLSLTVAVAHSNRCVFVCVCLRAGRCAKCTVPPGRTGRTTNTLRRRLAQVSERRRLNEMKLRCRNDAAGGDGGVAPPRTSRPGFAEIKCIRLFLYLPRWCGEVITCDV